MFLLLLALQTAATPAQGESVPFELVSNLIIVRGSINGHPATLVVDSGANGTVVTPAAAKSFGIEGKEWGVCGSIGAGKALVRDLRVALDDPPQAQFLRRAGADYAAILGTNYFEKFVTTLDYANRTVVLTPAASAPETRKDALSHVVTFERKNNLIFVEALVNARDKATLILDCGAASTVILPRSATRFGVAGEAMEDIYGFRFRRATFDSIAVGSAELSYVRVAIMEIPQISALREAGIAHDGLLGYTFLSRYRVTLDYRTQRIRFAPPGSDGRAPLGLELAETRVKEVIAGSQAERAGFELGDVILSIDRQSVRYVEQVRAILDGAKPGATLTFVVRRGQDEATLTVTH